MSESYNSWDDLYVAASIIKYMNKFKALNNNLPLSRHIYIYIYSTMQKY
jgi:hypothetical protein